MESMNDMKEQLETSYKYMGDGERDTDTLLAWEKVAQLLASKEEVTVTVTDAVKAGVITQLEGLRAFIPASKLSLKRVEDLTTFVGQELKVQVITAEMEGDKLVLSAVESLKRERAAAAKAKLDSVHVGDVVKGTVETMKDFGVFVRLENGLSGLLHISQISASRIKHPSQVLKEGDEVTVKITQIKDGKLSLSIRALNEEEPEPEEDYSQYTKTSDESFGTSLGDLLKGLKLD